MREIPPGHPLRKLFRWATRNAFRFSEELHAEEIEDYLSDWILARFVHSDNLYIIRNAKGRKLGEVAGLMAAGAPGAEGELAVNQHIGDYVLFMAGLFPEGLTRHLSRPGSAEGLLIKTGAIFRPCKSPLEYYVLRGQASYRRAYDLAGEKAWVFQRLSDHFGGYVSVMSLVRLNLEGSSFFRSLKDIIGEG
ncbi:MAG: hypothetical protein Kow0025_05590 [Thermodesulfovibrionales bacterium]